jgi:hypothetical protein
MSNFISTLRLATLALLRTALFVWPLAALADIELSINIAPPPLPVYEQPPVPTEGYLWTPGYWMYVLRVISGCRALGLNRPAGAGLDARLLGWSNALYVWNSATAGRNVGFYGGVNYGYGYYGRGYEGGYWRGNDFSTTARQQRKRSGDPQRLL